MKLERIFAVLYVSIMGLTRCYKTTVLKNTFIIILNSNVIIIRKCIIAKSVPLSGINVFVPV